MLIALLIHSYCIVLILSLYGHLPRR